MSIHSENEAVILEFGLKKPAFRICVNTPTTHGSIGLTTGLDPAMTLGCGGYGGNITSDNISPKHLLNIKRLAWELRPAGAGAAASSPAHAATAATAPVPVSLPQVARPAASTAIEAGAVAARIATLTGEMPRIAESSAPAVNPSVAAFVCEDDVRTAIKLGRTITIGERTIVTPAARDAGDAARIFVYANWRN
jgi:acetaldehyde dehydrogenase (acetylating)